jgi:hypothetical protein
MGELVRGVIRPETRLGLLAVARRLREQHEVDAIVRGGTELPLMLREPLSPEVPFLDTTAMHVKRIRRRDALGRDLVADRPAARGRRFLRYRRLSTRSRTPTAAPPP